MGRMRRDLAREIDVLAAARAIFHITLGARIPWANGLIDQDACLKGIREGVGLLFRGLEARTDVATRSPTPPSA
jgi:hypothetical protein